ncbi:MAG: hypothetical protein R2939_00745 [Kofleriaceae bacterium]
MRRAWGFAVVVVIGGCGDPADAPDAAVDAPIDAPGLDADPRTTIAPGPASGLGPDEPSWRQDEDPAVAVDADGNLLAMWYSNRESTIAGQLDKQVFAIRSTDAVTWSDAVQVSQGVAGADWGFAPTLAIAPDGAAHAVWWNMHLLPDGCTPMVSCTGNANTLWSASAADQISWSAPPEQVTSGLGDWLPSLVIDRVSGTRHLLFAAVARRADGTPDVGETTSRLFVITRTASGWGAVVPLVGVNAEGYHHSYPFAAQRADGRYLLTWTRWPIGAAGGGPLDVLTTDQSETMVAESDDGVAWTSVRSISEPAGSETDVFPSLFGDPVSGAWWVVWVTTDGAPQGHTVELPWAGTYPADRVLRPELAGYSPRAAATATPGVRWGVWVEGTEPTQRVRSRFFAP